MVRLIQVKYPDLVEQVRPARRAPGDHRAGDQDARSRPELGLKPEEIGIFYIAPCPAKIVSIKQPAEKARSWFDGAVSSPDVYPAAHPARRSRSRRQFDETRGARGFLLQRRVVAVGGAHAGRYGMKNWLAVSGLDHVMRILDDIESSRLRNIDFVEALTCMLGCIGGPFCVENPYVARANSIKQSARVREAGSTWTTTR